MHVDDSSEFVSLLAEGFEILWRSSPLLLTQLAPLRVHMCNLCLCINK